MIFYTEKFYYNSVEKIQIGLISDKNIRRFTCDFELLLGQTPLGASTANTGTGKGSLLRSGRTERLSLVHLRPYISLYLICTSGRQATVVSPLKCCDFFFSKIKQLPVRTLPYTSYNCPFHRAARQCEGSSNEPRING